MRGGPGMARCGGNKCVKTLYARHHLRHICFLPLNASLSTHSTPTHMERRKAPPYQLIAGDHYNLTLGVLAAFALATARTRKTCRPSGDGSSTRAQTGI